MTIYPQDLSVPMYQRLMRRRLDSDGMRSYNKDVDTDIARMCEFFETWKSEPVSQHNGYISSLAKALVKRRSPWKRWLPAALVVAAVAAYPLSMQITGNGLDGVIVGPILLMVSWAA